MVWVKQKLSIKWFERIIILWIGYEYFYDVRNFGRKNFLNFT